MPTYRYRCPDGHVTQQRGGFDDDEIACPACGLRARREAIYREQGILFKGGGWGGKSSIPPPPEAPTSEGESPDTHFEKLDEFAERHYDHERNVVPYKREEADRFGGDREIPG